MILEKGKNGVETTLKGKAFQLEGNVTLYSILSDKLYQHKVRAVIRELSTNAVDSHIKAGTTNKPIKVTLPTAIEPQFVIRDYGTGLSPDEIDVLYSYGSSTKKDSNLFNGALGIGSKSPFAYAQTFNVNSYYNGEKYMYTVFSDNGVPTVVSLGSEKTDEPNGLEITVPVQVEDIFEFVKEAQFVYKFLGYPVDINIDNIITLSEMDTTISGTNWAHYPTMLDSYIVMSGVAYPTNSIFSSGTGEDNIFKYQGIVYHIENGKIDFSASRESIENTPHNRQVLEELSDQIKKEMTASVNQSIKNVGSISKFLLNIDKFPIILFPSIVDGLNKFVGENVFKSFKYSRLVYFNTFTTGIELSIPEKTFGYTNKYILRKVSKFYDGKTVAKNLYNIDAILIIEDVKNRRAVIREQAGTDFKNYVFLSLPEIQALPAKERKAKYNKLIAKYKIDVKEVRFASDYAAPVKKGTARRGVPVSITRRVETHRIGYDTEYTVSDLTVEELTNITDAIVVPVVHKNGDIISGTSILRRQNLKNMFSSYSVFFAAIKNLSYKHKKDIVLVSVTQTQYKSMKNVWTMDLQKLFKYSKFNTIVYAKYDDLIVKLVKEIAKSDTSFIYKWDIDKVIQHPVFKLLPSDIKKSVKELKRVLNNSALTTASYMWVEFKRFGNLYDASPTASYSLPKDLVIKYKGIKTDSKLSRLVKLMVSVDRLSKTMEDKINDAFQE